MLILSANLAQAQSEPAEPLIDSRLIDIVEIVKGRIVEKPAVEANVIKPFEGDALYLDLIDKLHTASYSRNHKEITEAVENFQAIYQGNSALSLENIPILYSTYAEMLLERAARAEIQSSLMEYTTNGNWFEQYHALSLLADTHTAAEEKQSGLQKAQLALSVIPTDPTADNIIYVDYAKKRIISLIAHLHNLQGNTELALSASLEYLRLTEDKPDLKVEVDLINNLIYSYGLGRDHAAELYLSEQLLEIEKYQSSSVAGLSEMRIAGTMNSSGRYEEALQYAQNSLSVATHPVVQRATQVHKAVAFAGLGRFDESRAIAKLADVNLEPEHMLKVETRWRDLYLAFLLAQAEDPEYATQLYNRQLDVKAQKFYGNNSRDTTAMLVELENSHERQAEREAATAREAKLQAMTISRQRILNRVLMFLSAILALAALAGVLFTRYRGRVLRKLEIKTREAASAEKLKTEFLGMISHELRTPLNGIIGISDYLANYHDDPDIRQKTGIILKGGNELLSVVESLTDMARIDAGQLSLAPHDAELGADLAEIPDNWTAQAAAKGLAFTHFIDPAIARHNVDGDRIVQCVNIILANAISFTESGRVHMHVTRSKTVPAELTVVVADTGQGMTELVQSRLFTPFMQADTSRKRAHMGTGLNLAIAYALVDMMGGALSCVSRAGRGSEFTFKIPLPDAVSPPPVSEIIEPLEIQAEGVDTAPISAQAPARPDPVSKPPFIASPILPSSALEAPVLESPASPRRDYVDLMKPAPMRPALHEPTARTSEENADDSTGGSNFTQSRKRILIVDDIDSNRDVLRLILESKGHVCGEAADGFTALAALERKSYDLVILDIHMAPLDGIETLRRLRNSGKPYANISVIALTADNAPSTNAETMDAGADWFLAKPIKREDLLNAIRYLSTEDRGRILSQQA